MQAYAKQANDITLIKHATEIRMRAERRAGELLIEMAERGERDSGKGNRNPALKSRNATPKLSDLGISKTKSSRWQKLAELDDDIFETRVEQASTRAYDQIAQRFIKEAKIERAKCQHGRLIADGCRVDDLIALAASGYRAGAILADVAWPWETWGGLSGKVRSSCDNHYGTCSLEEIARLPVAPLAAEHCALFLWCTWPHIVRGNHIPILRAWGFEPATAAFVWVKQNPSGDGLYTGMGYATRSNSEVCIYATKGSPLRLAADVHQIVLAPVSEHSAKPEEVRKRIERLVAGPYLELYARTIAPGWTAWGNEIPRDRLHARNEMATR
jgi:N6-adenosine-specific RNA methylase IME4